MVASRLGEEAATPRQVEQWRAAVLDAAHLARTALNADAESRLTAVRESAVKRDADDVEALLRGVLGRLGHRWEDPDVRAALAAELRSLVGTRAS